MGHDQGRPSRPGTTTWEFSATNALSSELKTGERMVFEGTVRQQLFPHGGISSAAVPIMRYSQWWTLERREGRADERASRVHPEAGARSS
jgi:hypothetical protein